MNKYEQKLKKTCDIIDTPRLFERKNK